MSGKPRHPPPELPVNQWVADVSGTTHFVGRIAATMTQAAAPQYTVNPTSINPHYAATTSASSRPGLSIPSSSSRSRTRISYARPFSSNTPPSLSRSGGSLTSSGVPTSRGVARLPQTYLEEGSEDEEISTRPTSHLPVPAEYTCIFKAFDCDKEFDNVPDWARHVLYHFRGHQPPSTANCCLCDESFTDDEDDSAWRSYLLHLAAHFRRGQNMSNAKVDLGLYRWMYSKGIIGERIISSTQLRPAAERATASSSGMVTHAGYRDEPSISTASRRSENRERQRARGRPPHR